MEKYSMDIIDPLTIFLLITGDEDIRWTAQKYLNPFINIEGCGNSETSPVCDPDAILDLGDRRTVRIGTRDIDTWNFVKP